MEERVEADSVDYISELPAPILHHILSLLPIKEIIRTSLLSKTWYEVWNTYSCILEFNFFALFRENMKLYYFPDEETKERNRRRLYNFVEQILLNRSTQMISFGKFTVVMPSVYQRPQVVSFMDRCIGCVVQSNVKELKITVGPFMDGEKYKYNLPHSVLSAKSIQKLFLRNCKLELPCSGNFVKLPFLTNLNLFTVYLDDNLISKIIAGCPLLEDLTLRNCYGFKALRVLDLPKLVGIRVEQHEELENLEIKGPNLRLICLQGSMRSWPAQIMLGSCPILEELIISYATITDKWLHDHLNNFPVLGYLSLFNCPMLENIKIPISSSHLHKLTIDDCKKVASVEIDGPNLQIFWYEGGIISFSSNGRILEHVSFRFKSESRNGGIHNYTGTIELLIKLNQFSKKLSLGGLTGECYIIPKELRQSLTSRSSNIENLYISILPSSESYTIAQLVDSLLWIFPHLKSLTIDSIMRSSFKFSYRNPTTCEKGDSIS